MTVSTTASPTDLVTSPTALVVTSVEYNAELYAWLSDRQIESLLDFSADEIEQFDCLPNYATGALRIHLITKCLSKLRPIFRFHILDCRDKNNDDCLEWLIAIV